MLGLPDILSAWFQNRTEIVRASNVELTISRTKLFRVRNERLELPTNSMSYYHSTIELISQIVMSNYMTIST